MPSVWSKTTLIGRCVGGTGADLPTSFKWKRFSYAIASKCANFQQKIYRARTVECPKLRIV